MDTAVVPEVLLLRLHVVHGLLLGPVLQPGDGATDPLQQLGGREEEGSATLRIKVISGKCETLIWMLRLCKEEGGSPHLAGELLVVLHH